MNQLKQKQLPNNFRQINFAILQINTLTPVHYLIQHENNNYIENLTQILSLLNMEQIRSQLVSMIKATTNFVKPLDSFSFKSFIPISKQFQSTC